MPASLSMIIMSMGVMLFNIILGSSQAVAAYQTAGRIEHFFFLPIISIATSLVTLVGMFYGAKRMDLVNQMVVYGISRAVVIAFSFSLLFFFIIAEIIPVFTSDQRIMDLTIIYFKRENIIIPRHRLSKIFNVLICFSCNCFCLNQLAYRYHKTIPMMKL